MILKVILLSLAVYGSLSLELHERSICHGCSDQERAVQAKVFLDEVFKQLRSFTHGIAFDYERFPMEQRYIGDMITVASAIMAESKDLGTQDLYRLEYAGKVFGIMRSTATELLAHRGNIPEKLVVRGIYQVIVALISLPLFYGDTDYPIELVREAATTLAREMYKLQGDYRSLNIHASQRTVDFNEVFLQAESALAVVV